jgi:hypothetical protein
MLNFLKSTTSSFSIFLLFPKVFLNGEAPISASFFFSCGGA